MADWRCRLEGGPADGDCGTMSDLPAMLWVRWCDVHRSWHWWDEWVQGSETYEKDEENSEARVCKYVYRDLKTGPQIEDEELVGAGVGDDGGLLVA